ncbi:MAG: sigma 54-interacting transcriptional regulator [Burkholderiaceae bacterium]|nr:sigma 54-interacting transcriptional regulator [Burkholderiaceae bacterium]
MQAKPSPLPSDAASILKLAVRSMFDLFESASQGMLLVDRCGRVVWINDAYRRFLPALGIEREEQFVGHPVSEVIPNTQMHQVLETGKPILVDLLTNKAGTFVVSRIPLRDGCGAVIGALGIVLLDHPETTLQPLIAKFASLQEDLDKARRELAASRRSKYTFASFIGSSAAALEVKRMARRAAQIESTVLLLGETGTGKELVAHAIHAGSQRARKPFISVNLAAVPDTLIEAEFFGVAPGAYTGADRKAREGKFKLADGGTLFLDEIGDMPLALQAKLLRVLQEQEIEALGSNKVVRVDVRVIAATSRNLGELVEQGRFRADLYYRLNVLPIRLPALRERTDDLEALAENLLEQIAARSGMPVRELGADVLDLLAAQPWRGNVRELRNALEQVAMMSDKIVLEAADFRAVLPARLAEVRPQSLSQAIAHLERDRIRSALATTGGNKVAAAKLLGISRATLYEKLATIEKTS